MDKYNKQVNILIAEDDDDDFQLTKEAFEEARLINNLQRVKDGEELMGYLLRTGKYQDEKDSPKPLLILVDLNMPRKDGREAIKEIKANKDLRRIPIVVLTTSKSEEDVITSYNLGVNSFIRKPVNFEKLVEVMRVLKRYWFEIVELPTF